MEETFDHDLHTNNPWFNPSAHKHKIFKKVRFATTEISSNELPYCRRHCELSEAPGQLHTSLCSNSAQETINVLGQNTWLNRVFILDSCANIISYNDS